MFALQQRLLQTENTIISLMLCASEFHCVVRCKADEYCVSNNYHNFEYQILFRLK